jgi:general secretion pathway protein E
MLDLTVDDRVAKLLLERGSLRQADLTRVARMQAEFGGGERLARLLVRLGMVAERDAAAALSAVLRLPLAEAKHYPAAPVRDAAPSLRFMKESLVVPIGCSGGALDVAMADPQDDAAARALELACRRGVARWVGTPSDIDAAIERLYGDGRSRMARIVAHAAPGEARTEDGEAELLRELASDAPAIRLVDLILQRAAECGASDIHLEPCATRLRLRLRIDGVLQEAEAPPAQLAAALASRVKIMAGLDIAERRLPQDGRMSVRVQGKQLDVRVATAPTQHGESIALRLLNRDAVQLDLASLGFGARELAALNGLLAAPHGMILVTGPTGSGKSTTLYAALSHLNTPALKVITVEDPVEYRLEGLNQIQVRPAIELSFAAALRSIVRHDPDVIMVGEMRDLETARICVQSALTGHLVLSTLHTNDAASSVTRLLEMGVEDYLLTSTLSAVIAQRLVRLLCRHCRRAHAPLPAALAREWRGAPPEARDRPLYRAVGCERCAGTGYRGRSAVLELMPMSERLRGLVLAHAPASDIAAAARDAGMRTMREDGLARALAGLTTLEEVLRVTADGPAD